MALVTQEDCQEIMRLKLRTCSFEIVSTALNAFPEKRGLLGEHFQLTIQTNFEGKLETHNFFVKTLPDIDTQKQFAVETGAFFKEHQFFHKMIPHMEKTGVDLLQTFIPRCFLTRLHDVAVFEDVEVQGYYTLPQRQSLSVECVSLVIKDMAKLHGAGYILEERISKDRGNSYRMLEDYEREYAESFYSLLETSVNLRKANQKAIVTEIDMFPDPNSPIGADCFKQMAVDYIGKYNDWVKPSKKFRNTFCHGDLWASNIMFKFENNQLTDCKIIDFQSYRYLPPAHDILCFLYLSTDRDFRSKYQAGILQSYYNELKEVLNEYQVEINGVLPYKDFQESCKEYQLFAASQSCTHFTSIMLTKKQLTELFADPEYNRKTFFEDRSDLILRTCAHDCEYKNRLKETIMDLRECFENLN